MDALRALDPFAVGDDLLAGEHGPRHGELTLAVLVVVHHLLRGEPRGGQDRRQDEERVGRDRGPPEGGGLSSPATSTLMRRDMKVCGYCCSLVGVVVWLLIVHYLYVWVLSLKADEKYAVLH